MLKGISGRPRMLAMAEPRAHPMLDAASSPSQRIGEALPGVLSWLTVLAPIWLTIIDPALGLNFVGASIAYFVLRGLVFGVRGLLNHPRLLASVQTDWLNRLQQASVDGGLAWSDCRITFLVRAFREDNLDMLRNTVAAIYASNWPRVDGRILSVEVVFATEEHDPITPPLVEILAAEFRDKLPVRQIRHPHEPGTLPGPSTAMHYVGQILYREAMQKGILPDRWLVADLDSDTLLHPQYLPCLVYHYVTDPQRRLRVYQPVVAFTIDYWRAPLHSRLSAIGNTALTVSWNRRPEIAFTGAAANLALLKSVDFWPTNSHSQDSGIDLRLRMRHGRRYRVVGLPVPAFVYPVMEMGEHDGRIARLRCYVRSFRALFRQSARWREGPLDECGEALRHKHLPLVMHRLWQGLERDTLTILPGYGLLAVRAVGSIYHPTWALDLSAGGNEALGIASTLALSLASLIGLVGFWQLLAPSGLLVRAVSRPRRVAELLSFWLVFGFYVPILTGVAGLTTATRYLIGRRPRGHFTPTPK